MQTVRFLYGMETSGLNFRIQIRNTVLVPHSCMGYNEINALLKGENHGENF